MKRALNISKCVFALLLFSCTVNGDPTGAGMARPTGQTNQTEEDSLIEQMQGWWMHSEDSLSRVEIVKDNWISHYGDGSIAPDKVFTIRITHHLPRCVDPSITAVFVNLINGTDTLPSELLGLADSTLSLRYCNRGNINLYYRLPNGTPQPDSKEHIKTPTTFSVKDSTQYSKTFLDNFRRKHLWVHEHIRLCDDSMIVGDDPPTEAILLPTDLPLDQQVAYGANHTKLRYDLKLTRINYSTVTFRYVVREGGRLLFERQGIADLDPLFHYGTEGDFEDHGATYGLNKYHPLDTTCSDYLLIGHGSIARASYIRACGNVKDSVLSMGMDRR